MPRLRESLEGDKGLQEDFDIEEHKEVLKSWAREFALKFEDFTADQIQSLKGPKGEDDRGGHDMHDGRNGKDFSLEENKEYFETLAKSFALKFENFTAEQIEKLRGPQGSPGKDFSFEESEQNIRNICKEIVESSVETLKLHFSDLTEEDIEKIRGPRGRDGRDGKDFIFEDHQEFFKSLKLKFSDLTKEEVSQLKLRFSELTEEDKEQLKLKFSDLTEDQKMLLRGPRGQKGKRGDQGEQEVS